MEQINKVQLLTVTKGEQMYTSGQGVFMTARAMRAHRIKQSVYTLIGAGIAYVFTIAILL